MVFLLLRKCAVSIGLGGGGASSPSLPLRASCFSKKKRGREQNQETIFKIPKVGNMAGSVYPRNVRGGGVTGKKRLWKKMGLFFCAQHKWTTMDHPQQEGVGVP